MGEHKYTGPIAGIFQKMADIIGKDVYVIFLILMFFTLFEVAAVSSKQFQEPTYKSPVALFGPY